MADVNLRYRLLPYIYSLFSECARAGLPVARSLAIEEPHNPKIYEGQYQNEYLFGPHFLVVPVASANRRVQLYLPEGSWYYFYTDERVSGNLEIDRDAPLEKLPLFVRAGAVIPMQTPVSCTRDIPDGPLEVHFYANGERESRFSYYEDDGISFDYKKGAFFRRSIRYVSNELRLEQATGTYESCFKELKVVFHGFDLTDRSHIRLNGQKLPVQAEMIRFFAPVSPFARDGKEDDPYGELPVFTATAEYLREEMRFEF